MLSLALFHGWTWSFFAVFWPLTWRHSPGTRLVAPLRCHRSFVKVS